MKNEKCRAENPISDFRPLISCALFLISWFDLVGGRVFRLFGGVIRIPHFCVTLKTLLSSFGSRRNRVPPGGVPDSGRENPLGIGVNRQEIFDRLFVVIKLSCQMTFSWRC